MNSVINNNNRETKGSILSHTAEKGKETMSRFNIFSSEKVRFADLEFDKSIFSIPEVFFADFKKNTRIGYKYDSINGEHVKTQQWEKIYIKVYDGALVKILKAAQQPYESINNIEVAITDGLDEIEELTKSGTACNIKLKDLVIKPKWANNRNGGSYSEIQFVASGIERVN